MRWAARCHTKPVFIQFNKPINIVAMLVPAVFLDNVVSCFTFWDPELAQMFLLID